MISGCGKEQMGTISWCDEYDIDKINKITTYKLNNKYRLISFENGKEITEALYEKISISTYTGKIVANIGNLEYAVDKTGKIISDGYERILEFNEKLIIILQDKTIDIIDSDGNSKLNNKINLNDTDCDYYRLFLYYLTPRKMEIKIEFSNDEILIKVPIFVSNGGNYFYKTYI